MHNLNSIFRAFKSGAKLKSGDVERLLKLRGHIPSNNRMREFTRDSDRGSSGSGITPDELYDLISEWADEQRGRDASDPR
jgi:hypothetical protein